MRKITVFRIFILLSPLLFLTCKDTPYQYGRFCDGKSVLEFQSLAELQNEHQQLFNRYLNGAEEDSVFINYEIARTHTSLRRKDEMMDNGTIPDDPDFNPFLYTTDEVFEAILNQDGMVAIDGEVYLWDAGCIVIKAPFTCENYAGLLKYRLAVEDYQSAPTEQKVLDLTAMKSQYQISEVNICQDLRFDFEFLSESGDKPILDSTFTFKSSSCGFNVFITEEFLGYDNTNGTFRYRLTANTMQIPGTNPFFSIYIDNVTSSGEVKIVDGSLPGLINTDWFDLSSDINGLVYPGEWVEIEVDFNLLNQLEIKLRGLVGLFSGNSCLATDKLVLDLNCPISISKEPLNPQIGEWKFQIQGVPIGPNDVVIWTFGDGNSTIVTGQPGIIHSYQQPCCEAFEYSVTATIENGPVLCENPIHVDGVIVENNCRLPKRNYVRSFKVDGKKARLLVKMKIRGNGTTKIKNKFRWRKAGTKSIKTTGTVFMSQGMNCISVDLNTTMNPNPKTLNKKRKLKQKLTDGNNYCFDLNTPYQVEFSHSNSNFPVTVMSFNVPCIQ